MMIKLGIIGVGGMGGGHVKNLLAGKVHDAELVAACDINDSRMDWVSEQSNGAVKTYDNADDLLSSKDVDAVIIATPHYDHPPLAIKTIQAGKHVLIEKPAGVYTRQVREMNEVAESSDRVFGIMYNQRTNPMYAKLKDLIESGEIGELKRTNWIITSWYRSQSYYDSGGWRASWGGEGGGVLLNQDPHQLDLWQWMCGMPVRLRAFAYYGSHHNIEVEDDVTAFVEYANGATGVFVTSTHDSPGTNRLEVSGDQGKIVIENGTMTFWRNRVPERQFNAEYKGGFGAPECWKAEVPIKGTETGHVGILNNWVSAITSGTPLLAPGSDGIMGLSISNAMHLSSWTDDWVEFPVDEDVFYDHLQTRIKNSTYVKPGTGKTLNVDGTFS